MPEVTANDNSGTIADQELSEFMYTLLYTLADNPRYGLGLKRDLGEYYGEEINHGKLYPNLNRLAEAGLIDIGNRDGRTNEYILTDAGYQAVLRRLRWAIHELVDDPEVAVSLVEEIDRHIPV